MEKLYQIETEFNNLEQEANMVFKEANEELSYNLEIEMLELNSKTEKLLKIANEGLNKIETLQQEIKIIEATEELSTAKEISKLVNLELEQIGLEDFKIEFNSLEEKTIALESISDSISKIWEGFKKMVKKIVDFISKIINKFLEFLGLKSKTATDEKTFKKVLSAFEKEKIYLPKLVKTILECKTEEDFINKVKPVAKELVDILKEALLNTELFLLINSIKTRLSYLTKFVNDNNGKALFFFLGEIKNDTRVNVSDVLAARKIVKAVYKAKEKEEDNSDNIKTDVNGTLFKNINLNGFKVGGNEAKLDIEIIAAGMAGIKDYKVLTLEDLTVIKVINFFLTNKDNNISGLKEECHIDSKVRTKTLTIYTGNSILKVEYGFDKDSIVLKEAEKKIDISKKDLLVTDLTHYVNLVKQVENFKKLIKQRSTEIKKDLMEITKISNSTPTDSEKAKCVAKNGQKLLNYLQTYITNLTKLGNVLKKYDCLYINQKFTL